MNLCLRAQTSSLSVLNCQTARRNVLQRLPKRTPNRLPASATSTRQHSTDSSENSKGDLTSSFASTASSENQSIPLHLRTAGRVVPKGVNVMAPPQNVLPEKPATPPYPCGHLSDKEVADYLFPLYERDWGVYSKLPMNGKPATLMLAKDITFVWHYPIVDFVNQLHLVAKQENHHPRVAYEFRAVEIRTQTHSAAPVSEDGTISNRHQDRLPGITLRDVRLAYLIEDSLVPFYDLGKVVQTSNKFAQLASLNLPGLLPPDSTEEPVRDCIVCGGDHWATTCPHRFTIRPRNPCELCGGDHWKFACPQYKLWRLSVKLGWRSSPSPTVEEEEESRSRE